MVGQDGWVKPPAEHEAHHPDAAALQAGLPAVRMSPADVGVVDMIVLRPEVDVRTVVDRVEVDAHLGFVGDSWLERGNRRMPDGAADPDAQVTVMNSRAALLMAGQRERMPLAGDQLYLHLDLSVDNLPTGPILTSPRSSG